MFLCFDCAAKAGVTRKMLDFHFMIGPLSRGACEDCHKTKTCIDITPPVRKQREEADEAYLKSPGWQRRLAEAQADEAAGRVHAVPDVDALIAALNEDTEDPVEEALEEKEGG